jgi:hypothetical protein
VRSRRYRGQERQNHPAPAPKIASQALTRLECLRPQPSSAVSWSEFAKRRQWSIFAAVRAPHCVSRVQLPELTGFPARFCTRASVLEFPISEDSSPETGSHWAETGLLDGRARSPRCQSACEVRSFDQLRDAASERRLLIANQRVGAEQRLDNPEPQLVSRSSARTHHCVNRVFRRGDEKSRNARSLIGRMRPAV